MGIFERVHAGSAIGPNITKLVYYEIFNNIQMAAAREKRLKEWKIDLIQKMNPDWQVTVLESAQTLQKKFTYKVSPTFFSDIETVIKASNCADWNKFEGILTKRS